MASASIRRLNRRSVGRMPVVPESRASWAPCLSAGRRAGLVERQFGAAAEKLRSNTIFVGAHFPQQHSRQTDRYFGFLEADFRRPDLFEPCPLSNSRATRTTRVRVCGSGLVTSRYCADAMSAASSTARRVASRYTANSPAATRLETVSMLRLTTTGSTPKPFKMAVAVLPTGPYPTMMARGGPASCRCGTVGSRRTRVAERSARNDQRPGWRSSHFSSEPSRRKSSGLSEMVTMEQAASRLWPSAGMKRCSRAISARMNENSPIWAMPIAMVRHGPPLRNLRQIERFVARLRNRQPARLAPNVTAASACRERPF